MGKIDLKVLLKKGETRNAEFRKVFDRETVITLSAFANTSGGTVIVEIQSGDGINNLPENWKKEIEKQVKPSLSDNLFIEIQDHEGKKYGVIDVSESVNKPVSFSGRYYERSGGKNKRMNLNEVINMFNTF